MATRMTRAPGGTATMTTTATSSNEVPHTQGATDTQVPRRLVLRAEQEGSSQSETSTRPNRRIHWAEDVVNNEGMGRKSSKICCIYHKPRAVGESSDESSSDSSSDESDSGDDGSAKPSGKRQRGHQYDHAHDSKDHDCHNHSGSRRGQAEAMQKPKNAYEQIPKN